MEGAPHMSLSYSEGEGVLALSRHFPVGVDLECLRPGFPRLSGCWSAAEQETLARARPQEACRLWTRKEAALKALGTGLALAPEAVCVQDPVLRWGQPDRLEPVPDVALWSLTVLPRSRLPGAPMTPARCNRASARDVFPAADGPTSASVRSFSIATLALWDGLDMSMLLKTPGCLWLRTRARGPPREGKG